MRPTRAYLAGLGTAGSLVLFAAVLFVLGSAVVTFDGWPRLGTPPAPATQVVTAVAAGPVARQTAMVTVRAPAHPRARGAVRRSPAAPAAPTAGAVHRSAAYSGRVAPAAGGSAPPARGCAVGCTIHRPRPAGSGKLTLPAGSVKTSAPRAPVASAAPAAPAASASGSSAAPVAPAPAPEPAAVQVAAAVPAPAEVATTASAEVEARVGPADVSGSAVIVGGVAGRVVATPSPVPSPLPAQP